MLDETIHIPEGAPAKIELVIQLPDSSEEKDLSFGECYAEVMGKAHSLPEGAAENHDHYLYGIEKR